jgi:hypothetical protein
MPMRLITPLMLALLMAAATSSASAQTSTEPAKKDNAPAEAAKPVTPPATTAPRAAKKDMPQLGTTSRVQRSHRVRRAASKRRVVSSRRLIGGWRPVWIYRAHERHGHRHYKLAWRKFHGYFAPGRVRVGAYVLPRRSWCACRGHGYHDWH